MLSDSKCSGCCHPELFLQLKAWSQKLGMGFLAGGGSFFILHFFKGILSLVSMRIFAGDTFFCLKDGKEMLP